LQHVLYPRNYGIPWSSYHGIYLLLYSVEFIGIGNKHHQYIFFGKTVFLRKIESLKRLVKERLSASILEPTRKQNFQPVLDYWKLI
jgi:hypothetical protein